MLSVVSNPYYEMVSNILCIFNFVMIYVGEISAGQDEKGLAKGPIIAWLSFEIIFNFIQAFELIFDIYANGSVKKAFSRKSRCVIESVCQVINLGGVILLMCSKITVDDYYEM